MDDHKPRELEMKNLLNQHNDFGYYNINVISVIVNQVSTDFYCTKITIIIGCELIKPENYYATIGAYRIIWENVCVKKQFSNKGLDKIAQELGVEYGQDDDLCQILGPVINNLTWADFSKSELQI